MARFENLLEFATTGAVLIGSFALAQLPFDVAHARQTTEVAFETDSLTTAIANPGASATVRGRKADGGCASSPVGQVSTLGRQAL